VSGSGGNGKDGNGQPEGTDEALPVPVEPRPGSEARGPEAGDEPAEAGLAPAANEEAEVEALRRERDELKDQLLRRRAEFENYRRRIERDMRAASVEAVAEALRRLVDSLDNLERALASQAGEAPLRQGVELTLRDLRAAFESQGVATLDPAGQPFDPALHQALLHEPVAGVPQGTVAEVFRKGYSYKDRLLRPALVKVSSGEPSAGDGGGEVQ
jgi:molecular chaperone GrpE